MKGSLYLEGDRPKERFQAMKYFHLGHRLEEIVTRERELTKLAEESPDRQETREEPSKQRAADPSPEDP
jgi:hypothetical protein